MTPGWVRGIPVRNRTGDVNALAERAGLVRASGLGYLMATALAGEPIPPGAFIGALTRNIS